MDGKSAQGDEDEKFSRADPLVQKTISSNSAVPPNDNDDKINAKIAELESKYARLEATFGNSGQGILMEGRANLPMSIKRGLSNETEFGRDDLLVDVKQLGDDNAEAIKILSDQMLSMQNDIASFKDLVESRIIKIEKVETDPFERDTEGLSH